MFANRHRRLKFIAALALLAALGAAARIVLPIIRPSIDRYGKRAEAYDGRQFVLNYERVAARNGDDLTLARSAVAGLRLTVPPTAAGGVTVAPGDVVSVIGVFRRPNVLAVTSLRKHPLRSWKFAATVPAVLFVAFVLWLRVRFIRGQGLALERRRRRGDGDA